MYLCSVYQMEVQKCSSYRVSDSEWKNKIIDIKKERNIMKKYICDVCGWIYDPEVGDPEGGIAPGTAFEDIPEDWVCPLCGVGKEDFSPVRNNSTLQKINLQEDSRTLSEKGGNKGGTKL